MLHYTISMPKTKCPILRSVALYRLVICLNTSLRQRKNGGLEFNIDFFIRVLFRHRRLCSTRSETGLQLLRLIPGDLYSACPHRQFHTLPGLLHSRAAPTLTHCMPSSSGRQIFTISMMVFGMTQPGREHTAYCIRGRHANH